MSTDTYNCNCGCTGKKLSWYLYQLSEQGTWNIAYDKRDIPNGCTWVRVVEIERGEK